MLSQAGEMSCTSSPFEDDRSWSLFPDSFPPLPLDPSKAWLVYLLSESISNSLFTRHKTTQRPMYDSARMHLANDGRAEEILLHNSDDEIMEGSITTPYFWRDGLWITPAERCGGNLGTTRRWALEKGLAVEGIIKPSDVKPGEMLILSNGVHGFALGIIQGATA